MITASLRMFLELGVVQKFKIDYEVRGSDNHTTMCFSGGVITGDSVPAGFVPLAPDCEEELSNCCIS